MGFIIIIIIKGLPKLFIILCCATCANVDACRTEIALNCRSFRSAVNTLQLLLSNFQVQCVAAWLFIVSVMCCQAVRTYVSHLAGDCDWSLFSSITQWRVESQSGKLKAMSERNQSIHSSCHSLESSFFIFSYLFLPRLALRFITALAIMVVNFLEHKRIFNVVSLLWGHTVSTMLDWWINYLTWDFGIYHGILENLDI